MKFLWAFAIVVLLTGGVSFAEDSSGRLDRWLKQMRETIEKVVPKKAPGKNTTAVSGVRSADANATDTIYWKGKKEDVSEAEVAEFKAALELAGQGKKEESLKKLEEFLSHYPSSAFAGDARTAIQKIKSSEESHG